jgi:hypothetical protein
MISRVAGKCFRRNKMWWKRVGVECNHSWNFKDLQGNSREHRVGLWSGLERLIFPESSLVLRKSFETFDGGKLTHTFTKKRRLKSKT